ncbi:MAG: hypothetical protein U1F67_19680 [Rubrivivax sp.]
MSSVAGKARLSASNAVDMKRMPRSRQHGQRVVRGARQFEPAQRFELRAGQRLAGVGHLVVGLARLCGDELRGLEVWNLTTSAPASAAASTS